MLSQVEKYSDIVIFTPHPDDEIIGCGILINRLIRLIWRPILIYLTNGVPPKAHIDSKLLKKYSSYNDYFIQRSQERDNLLKNTGLNAIIIQDVGSRELHLHIEDVFNRLEAQLNINENIMILCPPYEGGHPDHDVSNFIASRLKSKYHCDVWEYALYNGLHIKDLNHGFVKESDDIIELIPNKAETKQKYHCLNYYKSQIDYILRHIPVTKEYFRPLPEYDYGIPPVISTPYYETWQQEIKCEQLCTIFKNLNTMT